MSRRSCLRHPSRLVLVLGLLPGLCSAGMTDPTRPLAGMTGSEPAGPAAGPARAAAPAAAPAAPPAEPQLQSLQLPRDGVASALVDGQLLRAGQRWNAFEIVAIDAQGVLAKGPGGPQRWTLVGVQYLDPKARARLPVPPPSAPVAGTAASAVSLAPASRGAPALHTAQWQFTPAPAAPAPAPALPPVTRLSWADLVAPAVRAPAPPAPRAAAPVRAAPAPALRLPNPQARTMLVAAGPSRTPTPTTLADAATRPSARWRGLRFEWPTPVRAEPRQRLARATPPLRGPLPPSLVLARPPGGQGHGLRWTAQTLTGEPMSPWWTPPAAVHPVRVAAAPVPATAARRAAPRPLPPRTWARSAPRTAPAYTLRAPLAPTPSRHAGPALVGVVALNKETP